MVYIQSDTDRKLPHHFDCACGLYGALDHGLEIRLTTFESENKSSELSIPIISPLARRIPLLIAS